MKSGLHSTSPVLIVGCGDIGVRVARTLMQQGIAVHGQVRSRGTALTLTQAGVTPLIADLDGPPSTPPDPYDLVFWFAPPPSTGDTDPRLRNWLKHNTPKRLVYISTSGVYGDCGNRWIDESEPLKPQTSRGRRRADAEAALSDHAEHHGTQTLVLRVPGIYGPGRLPIQRLRQGLPVIFEEQSPTTNRIHADDLARAAIAAAQCGTPGMAYNVSDGSPTTMTDYFCRCAQLLGFAEPRRISLAEARQTFTPAMLSFLEESKRLLISRMRHDLGVEPRYPDLASGLPSCLPSAARPIS